MAEKTFSIKFDGYWREINKTSVPDGSGIYCVYSCIRNESEKNLSIKKLIYIGESENVNARINNHEKLKEWNKYLKNNEVLCYSFGGVETSNRERCEAALIYKHKPPVNTEYADSFPYDRTTMILSDHIKFLEERFTVERDD